MLPTSTATPGTGRTGDPAKNSNPTNESAAGWEPAARAEQSGAGANRQAQSSASARYANSVSDPASGDERFDIAFVDNKTAPISRTAALTWAELAQALAKPVSGSKGGLAWVPAKIPLGPRQDSLVQHVSLLVIDIEARTKGDQATGVKTVIGPEPPEPIELADEVALCGWAGFIHTSYSHLDAAIMPPGRHPRYRLVLRLSRPLERGELRPLALHVASRLGVLPCLDTSTLHAAALFYMPRVHSERLDLFEHHVIEGDPLEVDALLAEAQRETAAARDRPTHPPRTGSVIAAFNAAHDIGALIEERGYIRKGHSRWLHPESTTGVPGVRLLPGEPARIFSSHGGDPLADGHAHDAFDVYRILVHGGNMKAAVKAAASVLGLPRGGGAREAVRTQLEALPGEAEPDPEDPPDHATRPMHRTQAPEPIHPLAAEAMGTPAGARVDPSKAAGDDGEGKGAKPKAGAPLSEDEIAAIRAESARLLADFGAHHAVAMIQGRAVIVYREQDADTGRHTTRYSTPADISLKFRPLKLPIVQMNRRGEAVRDEIPLFPVWLECRDRTTYQQLVFKPVAGRVAGPVTLPKTRSLNLFQGLNLTPRAGDCTRMKAHIRDVWCSGSEVAFDYVWGWLARMFQLPGERGHTVIVLRSGEGSGKGIIIDELVRAFGEHAVVAVKPDGLVGRFNDDLATAVLVFANEAVWGGNKELEGALKSLITDIDLPVERKYIPKFRVNNCTHLLMASNNDWVAPIGLDDRRFVVLDVNDAHKGNFTYFEKLHAEIASGGTEALVHDLLNTDLTGFNPRELPKLGIQKTKFDAKVRGADSVTQWWIECLYSGSILAPIETEDAHGRIGRITKNLAVGWDLKAINVLRTEFNASYLEWANKRRKHIESMTSFGRKLHDSLGVVQSTRPWNEGEGRKRHYVIPTLDDCRAKMDDFMGQPGPWEEGQ